MTIKKAVSLLLVFAMIFPSALALSAANSSEFVVESYEKEKANVTPTEIDYIIENCGEQIQTVLNDIFSEQYGNETVYIGSSFKIYNEVLFFGRGCSEYFLPVFLSDGEIIGFIDIYKYIPFFPDRPDDEEDPRIGVNCANLDYTLYFPFREAVAYIKEQKSGNYVLCAVGAEGDCYGVLDESNKFEFVEVDKDTWYTDYAKSLSFKKLSESKPEAVVGSEIFTLNKDTAKAFTIAELEDITLNAGVEDVIPF